MPKSFYNKYESEPEQQEDNKHCPAQDCPLRATVYLDGGPWTCAHHAKQPKHIWPMITEYLRKNKRWLDLLRVVDALRPDEYDSMLKQDAFELDELIMPQEGESHSHWVGRTKTTISKAMKSAINNIADNNEISLRDTDKTGSKWAVSMLKSGALMKKPEFKSRKQQLEEAEAWKPESA